MALRSRVDLGGFVYAFEYVTPERKHIVYVGASTRTVDTRMKEHNREWKDDYKSQKFYKALSPYIGRNQVLSAHVKLIYTDFLTPLRQSLRLNQRKWTSYVNSQMLSA